MPTSPRLIFFKDEAHPNIDFPAYREAFTTFMDTHFEVEKLTMAYSTPYYHEPSRENEGFGGYTRSVYYQYEFSNHHAVTVHFYDDYSGTEDFAIASMFSFYALSFYFTQGDGWSWVKDCWQKVGAFMKGQHFRDATCSFTFGESLFDHFQDMQEDDAMAYIIEETERGLLKEIAAGNSSSLEIQLKPFLNLDKLLAAIEPKERILHLHINHNQLRIWPDALFEYPNLKTIMVFENRISESDKRFEKLKQLEHIHLRGNPLANNATELEKFRKQLPQNCRLTL